MKKTILAMSAVISAALFFSCAQPETPPANNSGNDNNTSTSTTSGTTSGSTTGTTGTTGGTAGTTTGTTTGSTTGTTGTTGSTTGTSSGATGGTGGTSGSTITPPESFTPPALPASQGTDIFAGKTFTKSSVTWTFNSDGTFTQTHTGSNNGGSYTYTESYRYSYNATSKILSTIPATIAVWTNNNQGGPTVMNYQQAYNSYSAMTVESALQSVPGDTLEEKMQNAVAALSPEDIASLNLPQNASNTQILQAYINNVIQVFLGKYSTITKYIVTQNYNNNPNLYRITEYYEQNYRAGNYNGYVSENGTSEYVYYSESGWRINGKTYHLEYRSSTNKYYKFNTLATEASGTLTATNIDNESDTFTINYTRNWNNGVNTFTFSFTMNNQQKNFTLTNPHDTMAESTSGGSTETTTGGSSGGTTTSGGTGTGTTDGTGGTSTGETTTSGGSGAGTTTGGTTDTSGTSTGGTDSGTSGGGTSGGGGTTGGGSSGSSGTGISITSTPPESFTPPALTASQGTNIFAGKTFSSGSSTWTFNSDGTFTQTHTGGSSSGNPYSYTESYRYSYNATSHILSTIPTTIALWSSANQTEPSIMNYQQAYNYFSAITVEALLQSVPGNATEEIMQSMVSQIAPEDIALLNLPENASNAQILQAYLGYSAQVFINQYSTITKYIVSPNTYNSSTEYLLTDYYDQDYRGGRYAGCYSPENGPYEYLYYREDRASHDNKTYNIEYRIYVNGSSTQDKYYKLNTLATEASGTITATNVDNASDTLTISYTRSWENGINTFNFSITIDGQAKIFILTNQNTTLTENTGSQN